MSRYGSGQRLHLRLFLEGLEVPVISASVTASEGAGATAQIEVVPTDRGLEFLPRTTVHLFYLDEDARIYGGEKESYRLLFMGEVLALSYTKAGYGVRSLILNCVDFSNYWDTTYLFQYTDPTSLLEIAQRRTFVTASEATTDTLAGSTLDLVISDMAQHGAIYQHRVNTDEPAGLLDGLFAILETAGGVQGVMRGLNDWATISERRVLLLNQIIADDGIAATELFKDQAITGFLKRELGEQSEIISFREIINLIARTVFYGVFPNPVARYVKQPLRYNDEVVAAITQPSEPAPEASSSAATPSATGTDPLINTVDEGGTTAPPCKPMEGAPSGYVVSCGIMSQRRHPTLRDANGNPIVRAHRGLDLRAAIGLAVYAPYRGRVVTGNDTDGAGKYVTLTTEKYIFSFFHLSDNTLAKNGTTVDAGTVLGRTGSTGASSGPHLHLEVRSIDRKRVKEPRADFLYGEGFSRSLEPADAQRTQDIADAEAAVEAAEAALTAAKDEGRTGDDPYLLAAEEDLADAQQNLYTLRES